jgi:hypothetical protein
MEYRSPNSLVAKILVSEKIGGVHVRRIGELLIAQQNMNDWFLTTGKRSLSIDEHLAVIEKGAALEEKYTAIWRRCESSDQAWLFAEGLPQLDAALKEAAEFFQRVVDQQGKDL